MDRSRTQREGEEGLTGAASEPNGRSFFILFFFPHSFCKRGNTCGGRSRVPEAGCKGRSKEKAGKQDEGERRMMEKEVSETNARRMETLHELLHVVLGELDDAGIKGVVDL